MTVAERTREAVAERPFLREALRAGVVNYAAAAAALDVAGDGDAVATALRRYAAELPARDPEGREARVTMRSGVDLVDRDGAVDGAGEESLLAVGGVAVRPTGGSSTAVLASGDVDAAALGAVLARFRTVEVSVRAAGVAGQTLVVVVDRRDGATAVRLTEAALDRVP
ncbi:MAG: hypothetical protein ABEJ79_07160 [Halolamina sp.]